MSRLGLASVVWAIACGVAQAQAPATAPTVDPGTKLNFAANLGGANLERTINHAGPPANRPELGSSYYYSTPKRLVIAVQVYDGGRRVPPGSTSPVITGEFSNELDSVAQQIASSGYSQLERPPVPSSCTYGSMTFRCITYGATSGTGGRVYSKLLLTGYQGHFVKIRIDWSQGHGQSSADAEAALQAFVPALMH